jgi:hypothetical protein
VLLAGRDQRERDGDLERRVGDERAPAPPQPAQRPGAPCDREQQRRADDHPRPRDEGGRHAIVDGDLDEQVGDPPEDRDGGEGGPGA